MQGGVRIWLISHSEVISQDGTYFLQMAREWSADPKGAMNNYLVHPGYPAAVAGAMWLMTGDLDSTDLDQWSRAAQAVSLAGGILTVAAVWAFAWLLLGDWVLAFLGAMLFGLGRKFAVLGADAMSDSLMLCFGMLSLSGAVAASVCLGRGRRAAAGWAAATGVLGALAYLVRPAGLVVLPAAILLWLIVGLWRRRWATTLCSLAACVMAAGVCMLPYMLTIGGLTAKWKMTEFGVNGSVPGQAADPSAAFELLYPVESPVVVRVVGRFFEAQQPILASLTCVYILLWVLWRLGRSELLRRAVCPLRRSGVLLIAAGWVLITPLIVLRYLTTGAMSHRYLMLLAAMMAGFPAAALAGLTRLGGSVLERNRPSRLARFLLPAAAVVISAILLVHTLRPIHEKQVYAKKAGLWLAERLRPGDALLTDQLYVMYYSQALKGHLFKEATVRKLQASKPELTRLEILRTVLTDREKQRDFRFVAMTARDTEATRDQTVLLLEELGFVRVAEFPCICDGRAKAKKTILIYQKNPSEGSNRTPTTAPLDSP